MIVAGGGGWGRTLQLAAAMNGAGALLLEMSRILAALQVKHLMMAGF